MGMMSSDDEQEIMDDHYDLQWHFDRSPPSERSRYERMNDDQKAMYEHSVLKSIRERNGR